jgi:hypothetical protein
MNKVILFLVLLTSLVLLMPNSINADASDNITLITTVIGDNVTIHLITNVIDDEHHSYAYWWGCCGDGWGEENDVPRSTPLYWLNTFPNMMTGIINPESVCNDVRVDILRIEPSSVMIGTPIDVVFVAESNCNYVGNISLLLNGRNNQSLGVDLTNLYNKTYRTTILTTGLQPGNQTIAILGSAISFNVVDKVVPTVISPPSPVIPSTPPEKTEDRLIMWVAIAIGGIILVTVILLVIFR